MAALMAFASEGIVNDFFHQRKTIRSLLDGKDLFFYDLLTKQTQLLHTSTRHYDYRTFVKSLTDDVSVYRVGIRSAFVTCAVIGCEVGLPK